MSWNLNNALISPEEFFRRYPIEQCFLSDVLATCIYNERKPRVVANCGFVMSPEEIRAMLKHSDLSREDLEDIVIQISKSMADAGLFFRHLPEAPPLVEEYFPVANVDDITTFHDIDERTVLSMHGKGLRTVGDFLHATAVDLVKSLQLNIAQLRNLESVAEELNFRWSMYPSELLADASRGSQHEAKMEYRNMLVRLRHAANDSTTAATAAQIEYHKTQMEYHRRELARLRRAR